MADNVYQILEVGDIVTKNDVQYRVIGFILHLDALLLHVEQIQPTPDEWLRQLWLKPHGVYKV